MPVSPEFLEQQLTNLQALLSQDAPVILSFRKLYAPSGFDLEQFANAVGIELKSGEVIQE